MPPLEQLSFAEQVRELATKGHFKRELSNRRLRALMAGKWVLDSLNVEYVWENQYPIYYAPFEALEKGPAKLTMDEASGKGYKIGKLSCEEKTIDIAIFEEGPLKGLVKMATDGIDAWYAEDEKLLGPYPKDPYKRIECLLSSRDVRIESDGIIIAHSTNNVFLHETMRPTLCYISPASILDWSMFTPSSKSTFCPYKGRASYYHLKVQGKEIPDAVWYYEYPVPESAQIQNRLCFYNEKVDVFIDGKQE